MKATFTNAISKEALAALDEVLLNDQGLVQVLPADRLAAIDQDHLRVWCHVRAIYLLPSAELVEWISERIGGREAIEVGSGNGVLGRALGIRCTDNWLQTEPEVRDAYDMIGQPTITYGADVERLSANEAVETLRPQVVVAAWLTHVYKRNEHWRGGNMYGVDELALVDQVETYIHVGAKTSHANKRILGLRHQEHRLPGLIFGRGAPDQRRVWVWGK